MRSKNLLSIWFYIEISSFIFIFFLIKIKNPTKSSVIYFIIRFLSSTLIFISLIISNNKINEIITNSNTYNMYNFSINTAFLLKIGSIPFHYWIFKIIENIEWTRIIILLTIQKIIPIWTIIHFLNNKILIIIIIIRTLILPWLPLLTKNTFYLIATSRINNTIWILISTITSISTSILFTISYFIINTNFIYILKKRNIKKINKNNSINISIAILSLIGFPPTPNFFVKIIIIKNFLLNNFIIIFLIITILIINIISSIIYIKYTSLSIINIKNLFNWKRKNYDHNFINLIINFSPILIIIRIL